MSPFLYVVFVGSGSVILMLMLGFLDPRKFKRRGGNAPGGAGSSKKK